MSLDRKFLEAQMLYEKIIADLEAKLAEKDEQIERRVAVYEKNFIEQTDENYKLKQQLAEKETRIAELEDKDWYEGTIKQLEEQNERLINQLAEKEKKIETQKKNLEFFYDVFNNPKGKQTLETINQDKISFTVEQLEKVKGSVQAFDGIELIGFIDNQIKQLKDGK